MLNVPQPLRATRPERGNPEWRWNVPLMSPAVAAVPVTASSVSHEQAKLARVSIRVVMFSKYSLWCPEKQKFHKLLIVKQIRGEAELGQPWLLAVRHADGVRGLLKPEFENTLPEMRRFHVTTARLGLFWMFPSSHLAASFRPVSPLVTEICPNWNCF